MSRRHHGAGGAVLYLCMLEISLADDADLEGWPMDRQALGKLMLCYALRWSVYFNEHVAMYHAGQSKDVP
jgi:hypothetical protein